MFYHNAINEKEYRTDEIGKQEKCDQEKSFHGYHSWRRRGEKVGLEKLREKMRKISEENEKKEGRKLVQKKGIK